MAPPLTRPSRCYTAATQSDMMASVASCDSWRFEKRRCVLNGPRWLTLLLLNLLILCQPPGLQSQVKGTQAPANGCPTIVVSPSPNPLVWESKGKRVEVKITSFAFECLRQYHPASETRLANGGGSKSGAYTDYEIVVTVDSETVFDPEVSNPKYWIEAVSAKGVVLGEMDTTFSAGRNHETIRLSLSESEIRKVVRFKTGITSFLQHPKHPM